MRPAGGRAGRIWRRWAALPLLLALLLGQVAQAQSLIRDEEIERTLRRIADPTFRAAGLDPGSIDVFVVNDPALNAFVAGGQNVFIHSGLVARTATPEQLSGVIAHETGHIAGGHLTRAVAAVDRAGREMVIASLLGLAAALAGSPEAGQAVFAGGATLAQRGVLAFSRVQEQSADQAAITFLDRQQLSPRGLLEFFQVLETANLRVNREGNLFLRSHPLTRDRIDNLRQAVAISRHPDAGYDATVHLAFARSRAKLDTFLSSPAQTMRKYPSDSLVDRYARAIAFYKQPDLKRSLELIDGLIAQAPDDPFFHELKGQVLFENGRVGEAVPPYRQAVRLLPDGQQIRFGLGRALLELNDRPSLVEAASQFRGVTAREGQNAQAWRQLGIAEGKLGNQGASATALAEAAVLRRNIDDAQLFVGRAQQFVAEGDPNWLRVQDLKRAIEDLEDEPERPTRRR